MFGGQLYRPSWQQQSTQQYTQYTKPNLEPEELRKQWKDISTAHKNLLRAHTTHSSTHGASHQILSQTFDSCNNLVSIYRNDILQLLDESDRQTLTIEPVEKYIFMICHYANQHYASNPVHPRYCIALYSEFLRFIEQKRYREASQILTNTGVLPARFYKTSFIFIPFVLGVNGCAFPGLLVISPLHRTIDVLDPSGNSSSNSEFPNDSVPNLLTKLFELIHTHVKSRFNPLEWRIRWNAASQQALDKRSAFLAIMANAMSIAFGYEIHSWLTISLRHSDNLREPTSAALIVEISSKAYQHKARRAALELLHGRFETFDQTRVENDESGTFAYLFGGSDYLNPHPVYQFVGDQLVQMNTEFTKLPDLRKLCFAVLGKGVVPQVGIVEDNERGSSKDRGSRRMLIARNTLKRTFGPGTIVIIKSY